MGEVAEILIEILIRIKLLEDKVFPKVKRHYQSLGEFEGNIYNIPEGMLDKFHEDINSGQYIESKYEDYIASVTQKPIFVKIMIV